MQLKKTEQAYIIQDIIEDVDDIRIYRFVHGAETFEFVPGDFLVARLDIFPADQASLTLASCPSNKDYFELMVKKIGHFGTQFFEYADIGSTVHLRPPTGALKIDLKAQEPICFLCHDYTVPAARSTLLGLKALKSEREMVLFHELSEPPKTVFREDLAKTDHAPFRWVVTTEGGITEELLRKHLDRLGDWDFCVQAEGAESKRFGNLLKALGVEKQRIRLERWS